MVDLNSWAYSVIVLRRPNIYQKIDYSINCDKYLNTLHLEVYSIFR